MIGLFVKNLITFKNAAAGIRVQNIVLKNPVAKAKIAAMVVKFLPVLRQKRA